jgi:hypothetical protein
MNETTKHKNDHFDGETLMSYIYGELAGSAAVHVEDHLLECADCRMEFADISEGHLSVFEWNKLEFEPLATPAINIEYAKKRGPFTRFAEAFAAAGKWRIAVPAFASLVITISGFAMFSGVFSNDTEMVKDQPKTTASPVAKPQPARVVNERAAGPEVAAAEIFPHPEENIPDAHPVTISTRPEPKHPQTRHVAPPKYNNTFNNVQMPSSITVADGPVRLSDLEELEDESPRLSDLFDEADAS